MPTLEKIRPVTGAPCWVNLMAQDLRAAQSFYTDVMDWMFRESILGSNFSVALACGEPVAGIGCCSAGGPPAVWAPYFAVKNADETAVRIGERGATLAVGPLPLGEDRVGIAADRDGAVFGFWEGPGLFWSVAGQCSSPAGPADPRRVRGHHLLRGDLRLGPTARRLHGRLRAGPRPHPGRGTHRRHPARRRYRPGPENPARGSWTSVSRAASRPRRPPLLPGANPHRFPHSPMSQTTPSSSATPMAPSSLCPTPDDSDPPLAEGRGKVPSVHTGRQPPSPPLGWTVEQGIGEGRRASRQ